VFPMRWKTGYGPNTNWVKHLNQRPFNRPAGNQKPFLAAQSG
jgi:hypothetical protein